MTKSADETDDFDFDIDGEDSGRLGPVDRLEREIKRRLERKQFQPVDRAQSPARLPRRYQSSKSSFIGCFVIIKADIDLLGQLLEVVRLHPE